MRRRTFIAAVAGAAAMPLVVRAQQRTPVLGFLTTLASSDRPQLREAFRKGLDEAGYADRHNLAIEYRFADNQPDRLRAMAADLIARKVDVIAATGGNVTGLIVKTLTSTIPVVFTSGADPVRAGLVASLSRPEANVTGVSWFSTDTGQKHIGLLRELLPRAERFAVLLNPNSPESGFYEQSAQEGARALGVRLLVLKASTLSEIDTAFAQVAEQRAHAVIVGSDAYFTSRARQFAILAARHAMPLIAASREMAEAGGLLGYGNSVTDAYRRAAILCGRLLKGAKPGDLPVDRATKFELAINLGTAKALGLTIPQSMLIAADEVIE
jgi:putative ABC transport system substrate-binding protein